MSMSEMMQLGAGNLVLDINAFTASLYAATSCGADDSSIMGLILEPGDQPFHHEEGDSHSEVHKARCEGEERDTVTKCRRGHQNHMSTTRTATPHAHDLGRVVSVAPLTISVPRLCFFFRSQPCARNSETQIEPLFKIIRPSEELQIALPKLQQYFRGKIQGHQPQVAWRETRNHRQTKQ